MYINWVIVCEVTNQQQCRCSISLAVLPAMDPLARYQFRDIQEFRVGSMLLQPSVHVEWV